jgi:hypothetical protein
LLRQGFKDGLTKGGSMSKVPPDHQHTSQFFQANIVQLSQCKHTFHNATMVVKLRDNEVWKGK